MTTNNHDERHGFEALGWIVAVGRALIIILMIATGYYVEVLK